MIQRLQTLLLFFSALCIVIIAYSDYFPIYMNKMEPIYFYARKQKFQSLSNFSPHPIKITDAELTRKYQTGEHCFHGEKYISISKQIK